MQRPNIYNGALFPESRDLLSYNFQFSPVKRSYYTWSIAIKDFIEFRKIHCVVAMTYKSRSIQFMTEGNYYTVGFAKSYLATKHDF